MTKQFGSLQKFKTSMLRKRQDSQLCSSWISNASISRIGLASSVDEPDMISEYRSGLAILFAVDRLIRLAGLVS